MKLILAYFLVQIAYIYTLHCKYSLIFRSLEYYIYQILPMQI